MVEFTVKNTQLTDNSRTFKYTRLTRSDITFADYELHVVLRLKRSEADMEHRGTDIVLAATGSMTCPVRALRMLFDRQPLRDDQPLFGFDGGPLRRNWMIATLRKRAALLHSQASTRYTGHSFRRGADQQASDNGLIDDNIKDLGRWSSDSFKCYFKQSIRQRFALSTRFLPQTSRI